MPFHAHEVFEDAWKYAPPHHRPLWRGLAQIAVGLTHAERGNLRGADALLRRGADTIASSTSTSSHDVDVPRLAVWSYAAAEAVRTGGKLPSMPRLSRSVPPD
jgi:predicted metal-dependent hydrolase